MAADYGRAACLQQNDRSGHLLTCFGAHLKNCDFDVSLQSRPCSQVSVVVGFLSCRLQVGKWLCLLKFVDCPPQLIFVVVAFKSKSSSCRSFVLLHCWHWQGFLK